MKNRLFVLLLFISQMAFGQTGIFTKPNNSYGTIFNRTRDDSLKGIPKDTTYRLSPAEKLEPRWIARQGDSIYVWSIYSNKWVLAGGAGGGGGGGYTVLSADTSNWNTAFRLSQKSVYFRNNLTYDTISRKLNDSTLLFKSISITGAGVFSKTLTDSTIAYVISGGGSSYTFPNHVTAPSNAIQFINDSSLAYITGNNWHYGVRDGRPGWYPDVATANSIAQTLTSTSNVIALVNDNSAPGNYKAYGTDGSGVKGFQPFLPIDVSGGVQNSPLLYDLANNKIIVGAPGTGGSLGPDSLRRLEFKVGDTNGPQNGDSVLTHSQLIQKVVAVYREGERMFPASTALGMEYNKTAGTITFHPTLSTGEKIIVDVRDTGDFRSLVLEASGGGGGGTGTPLALVGSSYTIASGVYTVTAGGSSWSNTGLSGYKFRAGQNGRIYWKYVDGTTKDAILGLLTSYTAPTSYGGLQAAVWTNGSVVYKMELGTNDGGHGAPVAGTYYGIYRDGTTGTIKEQSSTDAVTWTDIVTATFSSTAALFIGSDINGDGKLYQPKGDNVYPVPGASYVSGASTISFTTGAGTLNNASGVWTGPGSGGYGNTGIATVKLPASTDGWIGFKINSTTAGADAPFGFKTANTAGGYATIGAGAYWNGAVLNKIESGTPASSGGSFLIGDFIRIFRTGSSGVVKLQKSTDDGATWTDIYTYTFTSTADLFIDCDINGTTGTLYYPQGSGLL